MHLYVTLQKLHNGAVTPLRSQLSCVARPRPSAVGGVPRSRAPPTAVGRVLALRRSRSAEGGYGPGMQVLEGNI